MDTIVKVLQIGLGEKEYSGVSNWLFEHYKNIDHTKVHWDFLFCRENTLALKEDSDVLKDSCIFALDLSSKTSNKAFEYILFYKELNNFLKTHKYDIVHVNTGSFPLQSIAAYLSKKNGIKIHIAHSHSAHNNKSGSKQKILNLLSPIFRHTINKYSDYRFACSNAAGKYLFGERADFVVLGNGIDVDSYAPNTDKRNKIRNRENISADTLVFYFVGRLAESKNLLFLLDVFFEIKKLNENVRLWIIGNGEMLKPMKERVKDYGIENEVEFWGERTDVPDILQGCDALIFTSFFEGLSMVVIEAQASGVQVFSSDSVSPEHNITGLVYFISLEKNAKEWAEYISEETNNLERKNVTLQLKEAGFDITTTAHYIEELYLKCDKKKQGD